jgi:hypothetical protein
LSGQKGKLKYHSENSVYEDVFSKYIGTIDNNINITMFLNKSDSMVRGYYYYNNFGEPIGISGMVRDDNSFEIIEEYADTPLGKSKYFQCKFNENFDEIGGEWFDLKRNKKLRVNLRKDNLSGVKVNKTSYEKMQCGSESDINNDFITGGCNSVSISLDEISGINRRIQDKINNSVVHQIEQGVLGYIENNESQLTPLKLSADFTKSMDNLLYMGMIDISLSAVSIDNNIMSFMRTTFDFAGGAHGNSNLYYSSYSLTDGEKIELSSIVSPDNQIKLFKIADSIYKSKVDKEGSEPLDIFTALAEKGAKNDNNFLITDGGLLFAFSQSEIASHAAGEIEIFVPYKIFFDIIRPNSIIPSVIKK